MVPPDLMCFLFNKRQKPASSDNEAGYAGLAVFTAYLP